MLGTGLQFGTVRGEDKFYIPVKARKNQQKQGRRAKNESSDSSTKNKVMALEDKKTEDFHFESSATPSNIERFLKSTTPLVPAQYFSKTTMRGLRTYDVEFQHYFPLNDLWEVIFEKLRSCDLLPSSWMSVAWYPIYRIPMGPTLKDLDSCFLTYHSLSTPMSGSGSNQSPVMVYPSEIDGVPKFSLTAFGMASYKFKGSMWTQNGISECQLANSLRQAADKHAYKYHIFRL